MFDKDDYIKMYQDKFGLSRQEADRAAEIELLKQKQLRESRKRQAEREQRIERQYRKLIEAIVK